MSAKVLRYCAGPLTPLVYHLFVLCIESCSLPAEWCTHLIVPIHKCGSKTNIKNYRPISLLCLLSKVLGKLIHQNVVTFLSKSFSAAQFGFIPGRSSLQQLLIYINTLIEDREHTMVMDAVYLDMQKAFDSVSHKNLLRKLWTLGTQGDLWHLFKAHLTNRTQCVRINQRGFLFYQEYLRGVFSAHFYSLFILMTCHSPS